MDRYNKFQICTDPKNQDGETLKNGMEKERRENYSLFVPNFDRSSDEKFLLKKKKKKKKNERKGKETRNGNEVRTSRFKHVHQKVEVKLLAPTFYRISDEKFLF